MGCTYSSEDVNLAVDSRSGMSNPSLWDIACTFDLIVLASLNVDTMYSIRDWFSRLDLASCISASSIAPCIVTHPPKM
jgi:hypothetical protein